MVEAIVSILVQNYFTCYFFLRLTDNGSARSSAAMEYAQRYMRSLQALHSKENATLDSMCAVECSWEDEEKTWLDLAKEEVKPACLLCTVRVTSGLFKA